MVVLVVSLVLVAAVWLGVYLWLDKRDESSLRDYLAQKHPPATWYSTTSVSELDEVVTTPTPFDVLKEEGRRANGR